MALFGTQLPIVLSAAATSSTTLSEQKKTKREKPLLEDTDTLHPTGVPTPVMIGAVIYGQTSAEETAEIVPSSLAYPPGNPFRYGADGTGGAADVAALDTASTLLNSVESIDCLRNGAPIAGYLRTAAEISASVLPSNYSYGTQPYDIRRFGAKLDNTADDTYSVTKALAVAGQAVSGALGSSISLPVGNSILNSMLVLPNRVRVLGNNKRGSYILAKSGWDAGTSPYMAYAISGTFSGLTYTPDATKSMFDSTLENLTLDCNNIVGLGGVQTQAWQEDCGLRAALINNFSTVGLRYLSSSGGLGGGQSLSRVADSEMFGAALSNSITAITQASSAVVTVDTVSSVNPFNVGLPVTVTGVRGMAQVNNLSANVSAIGGSSGAWTFTVPINSTRFSRFTSGGFALRAVGIQIDQISAVGSFLFSVTDTSITGNVGPGQALCRGINMVNDSLHCRNVHFEDCFSGVYVSGAGNHVLIGMTGSSSGQGVQNLVEIDAGFTGTMRMIGCFRGGATNFLLDHRAGGLGLITGYDEEDLLITSARAPRSPSNAAAWCTFNGTISGTNPPTSGYNVSSVVRNSAGNYSVQLTRPMANSSCPLSTTNSVTAGIAVATQVVSASSFNILVSIGGTPTDVSEVKGIVFSL